MGRGKQKRGIGDTIESITKAIGIEPCTPCEERKKFLNEKFSYRLKLANCFTDEQKEWYDNYKKVRTLTLTNEQRKKICELYAYVFNTQYFEPCVNCSPKPYLKMIEKLDEL